MMNEIVLNRPKDIQVEFEGLTLNLYYGGDAQSNDIRSGKTAYVNGELVTGTVPIGEANVNADQMLEGAKAINANGELVTGTIPYWYLYRITVNEVETDVLTRGYYMNGSLKIVTGFTKYDEAAAFIRGNQTSLDLKSYCEQTRILTLPIKPYANYNGALTSLTLPTGTYKVEIGDYAFYGNSITTLNGNVSSIGIQAFRNNNLTSCTLKKITTVGNLALGYNTSLRLVDFDTTLTSLGTTILGSGVAAQSPAECTLIFRGTTPPTITTTTFGTLTGTTNKMNLSIYVPDSAYTTYTSATNWVAVHNKWPLHKLSELEN